MKNLVWAGAGLIVAILAIFIFATRQKTSGDTVIPTPTPVGSPGLEFFKPKEATMEVDKKIYKTPPPVLSVEEITGKKVKIKTAKGDIIIELFADAPMASSNFMFLTKEKFYDGLTFHRREEKFVIQGGDPLGNGTGGPGYAFADEKVTRDYKRGIVAMANAGPNTNGSQFFIMLADVPLPKDYTIFGQVTSGIEVVDKIAVGDVMQSVTLEY